MTACGTAHLRKVFHVADVELFHIRDLDSSTQGERDRALSRIRQVIPFASVMEVGSTAVEGVLGKQDLDFVARVPRERFGEARNILDVHFQRNDRQLSNAEYQGYLVHSPVDVAVQLIVAGGQYDNFEEFVRLLHASVDLRNAYNSLKLAWDGRPMEDYRAAKRAFILTALNENASAKFV